MSLLRNASKFGSGLLQFISQLPQAVSPGMQAPISDPTLEAGADPSAIAAAQARYRQRYLAAQGQAAASGTPWYALDSTAGSTAQQGYQGDLMQAIQSAQAIKAASQRDERQKNLTTLIAGITDPDKKAALSAAEPQDASRALLDQAFPKASENFSMTAMGNGAVMILDKRSGEQKIVNMPETAGIPKGATYDDKQGMFVWMEGGQARSARVPGFKAESGETPALDPAYVEALSQYKVDLPSPRSKNYPATIAAVLAVNPKFDAPNFAARKAAVTKFLGAGRQGDTVRFFNTAVEHLDTLSDLTDALANGETPAVNWLANQYAEQTGSTAPVTFDAAKDIVAAEIAKAIIGGQTALGDRQELAEKAKAARSPKQLKGVIDAFQELMVGQLHGLENQYKVGTKNDDFRESMLLPRSREILEKMEARHAKPTKPTAAPAASGWGKATVKKP